MFKIESLNQQNALEIANHWKYSKPYSFYDMTEDPDDYAEIITPDLRGDNYFQVVKDDKLYGFFAISITENILEIGIGMKPEHTGNGNGQFFFEEILSFLRERYSSVETVRLAVVDFNLRAQKLYRKLGFVETRLYTQESNNSVYSFIEMERPLRTKSEEVLIINE